MKSKILSGLALASFFFFVSFPCLAEDMANETDYLRRETRSERQAAGVAERSKEKEVTDKYKTGVTYQDILKDPDNIALNVRYAQEQIAREELASAAATLERVLMLDPNLTDVRFLYAVVLYRLRNLNDAQKELDALKTVALSSDLQKQVTDYERKIKRGKRRTHFDLRESVGWGYDTNRNAAPISKRQLVNNTVTDVLATNGRTADTHFLNVSSLDVTHDLGFQAGHTVFGSFTYFLQDQNQVSSLDLGSYQTELGGTYKAKWFDFTPSFIMNYIFLSSESFLRTQGGNFLFERNLTKKLKAFYDFKVERQDYMNISEDTNARGRKGPEFSNFWGASYLILPTMKWTSAIGYSDKEAKEKFNAYDRLSLNNTHTWVLPKGQFLINTFNVNFDDYSTPEFAVGNLIRHDKTLRYRATYGAPLETLMIGKILPKPFKDVVLTFSYEYYRAFSNISNYAYANNKIEGMLTKRWEF